MGFFSLFNKKSKPDDVLPDDILKGKNHKTDQQVDGLYGEAIDVIFNHCQASASILERYLHISYSNASRLITGLEKFGIISPQYENKPRKILAPNPQAAKQCLKNNLFRLNVDTDYNLNSIDRMEGHEFERFCASILQNNGFINVEITKGSGDQGVDILAEKDGITYAIQCKCYSSDLGNKPIQEVNAGKTIYHRHIGVVMTNRYFTAGAQEAAKATGVLLWNRDKLLTMI